MTRTARVLVLLALAVTACGGDDDTGIAYDIHSLLSTEGEVVLELLIDNEATEPLEPRDGFRAVFVIQSEDGPARASTSVDSFPTVDPGDTQVVFTWSGELAPGTYAVVWGQQDRAVRATLHVDDAGFAMSGLEATTLSTQIVPTDVSPLVERAMQDVAARGDDGEAVASGVQMGIPDPEDLVIEITTTSGTARRIYRYHRTPDGLELVALEETPLD